jgi:hypothetical protein
MIIDAEVLEQVRLMNCMKAVVGVDVCAPVA